MILQTQRGNLALAASPVSTASDLAGVSAAQASQRELIAQLQQVRASGRVVFSFKPESQGTDAIPEVSLENGDAFLIPSVPSTVNAVGAIFNFQLIQGMLADMKTEALAAKALALQTARERDEGKVVSMEAAC